MNAIGLQEACLGLVLRISLQEPDADGELQAVDLSGSPTINFIFTDAAGTVTTRTGSVYGTATNGVVTYTTVAGDLDTVGVWGVRVKVTYSVSRYFHSATQRISVRSNTHRQ